jgi:methyl-accepting chemotaxis protein
LLLPLLVLAAAPARAGAAAAGDGGEAPVALSEGWAYRWGDSPLDAQGRPVWALGGGAGAAADGAPAAAGGGEGDWQPVAALTVPPGREGRTLLWLRLPLPQGAWEDPALLLGTVTSASELYLEGGERLHAAGEIHPGGLEEPYGNGFQLIPLPPAALGRPVYLRVQSSTGGDIGVRGRAELGTRADLLTARAQAGVVNLLLGAQLTLVGLVALGVWLARRHNAAVGFFALYALGAGAVLSTLSDLWPVLVHAPRTGTRTLAIGASLLSPALASFAASAFRWPALWHKRARLALWGAGGLLTAVALLQLRWVAYLVPLLLATFLSGIVLAALTAWRAARRGSPEARLFLAGALALLLTAGAGVVLGGAGGRAGAWLNAVGFLAFTCSLAAILVRRVLQLSRVEEDGARLEARLEAERRHTQQLADAVGGLVQSVARMRAAGAEQTAALAQQSTSLQETERTATALREAAERASIGALALGARADEAAQEGGAGEASVEQSLAQLAHIGEEVAGMARDAAQLGTRAREIAGVVATVKDVADQLNMLALNASIEAMRAGEHGRGFGVVAREVRSLADQSRKETERIRGLLDALATSAHGNAERTRRGEAQVRTSLERVRESGERLRRLAAFVRETGDGVRDIVTAVGQQGAGISELFTAVQEQGRQMEATLGQLRVVEAAVGTVDVVASRMAALAAETAPAAPTPAVAEGRGAAA